jgi:NADH dehydrogenase
LIFIAGASGFVGGHLAEHLIKKGQRTKMLVRTVAAGERFSSRGVEIIPGDITKPETLKDILTHDDIVIHLVGIIEEKGEATFQKVHVEGTGNLVNEARRAGVRHFFYQSALGADINSWSGYLKTKAEAEELVKDSGLPYTIFRPSLIIGPWDGFTKKILDMLRLSPVLPVPGDGRAQFQPLYIKDWLKCMDRVVEDPGAYKAVFDLGGPQHLSYREIVEMISAASGHKRPVFNIPMGLMRFGATILSGVLSSPPVTPDQLRLLEQDNITDPDAVRINFGFEPMGLKEALTEFMH